ncbi:hypothetical protein PEC18_19680 [Paucibacter sp. O1-1]|nr:hypothetical protein [Paucibacter sp. O1-1]MDA3827992.1 hypothetical protein [Paucibacter sp. O1-1]
MTTDTIVAQATAPGRGGVGIIRVSGDLAANVANAIIGHVPKTRYAPNIVILTVVMATSLTKVLRCFLKAQTHLLAKMC